MKRKDFIKAFAAACIAPVVAAKAIASHKKTPPLWVHGGCRSILDYKPTAAYSLRKLNLDVDGNAYAPIWYDQSGNGNHLIREKEVVFKSDWGKVKMRSTD